MTKRLNSCPSTLTGYEDAAQETTRLTEKIGLTEDEA